MVALYSYVLYRTRQNNNPYKMGIGALYELCAPK